jgi:ATP-dependent helicase HepA
MALIDSFELLMHGVQAIRRRVELLACPISGASGVRAQFYPHQLQNVQRILTSTRIHHLIADEVGMGKTIQALMIANALRLQKGKLRVRIVVPRSELQVQWIKEVNCRAHCTAELGISPVGDDWFDVIDESSMTKPSETLEPSSFDLLILDEPQSLKVDTLRFVAANSTEFPRVLLLTASPNLRDIRRLLELLQILEPERVERARREADSSELHDELDWSRSRIGDLDSDALQLVYSRYLEHCAIVESGRIDTSKYLEGASEAYKSFAEHRRVRVVCETQWMYRRILRSYRSDYPNHLPRREPRQIVIESTLEESERMRQAINYIGGFLRAHTDSKYRNVGTAVLQRTALGGQSLQAMIRQLRRGNSENDPVLIKIGELAKREIADSRLDCLVDWLVKFWSTDSTRKVVIAAEDNVTIDELQEELSWRIPLVGPRLHRTPLIIVKALDERLAVSNDEELSESRTLTNFAMAQLREFEDTRSQLLLAHHVFRQSYNLQAADALVFFCLPWRPEDVDQWIGRVDRLGRDFVDPERPSSRAKPIRIVTIHRFGDPTLQVQTVLDEFRVFESAIDPERRLLEQISERIEAKSLPIPVSSNRDVHKNPLDDDLERGDQGKVTAAPSGSHWSVEQAIELHNELAKSLKCGPTLRQTKCLGYVSSGSEEALARWIALLRQHKFVNITTFKGQRQAEGRRSRTYYTLGQSHDAKLKLDATQDQNHKFVPFFIARGNIQRPPRLTVNTSLGGSPAKEEPLQFLSFGSQLHSDLVNCFEDAGKKSGILCLTLFSLGKRHYPEGTDLTTGVYLVGAGFIDPSPLFLASNVNTKMLEGITATSGARRNYVRERAVANALAGIESDIRFVRSICGPTLELLAWKIGPDKKLEITSSEVAADLLGGNWSKQERPNVSRIDSFNVSSEFAEKFKSQLANKIANEARSRWAKNLDFFQERLEERKEMIRIDAESSLCVLRSASKETERLIDELAANPSIINEQRMQLNYVPQLKQLEEECLLVERSRDIRLGLLDDAFNHVSLPNAGYVELQCIAAIQMENDPVPIEEPKAESETLSDSEFVNESDGQEIESPEQIPNKPR